MVTRVGGDPHHPPAPRHRGRLLNWPGSLRSTSPLQIYGIFGEHCRMGSWSGVLDAQIHAVRILRAGWLKDLLSKDFEPWDTWDERGFENVGFDEVLGHMFRTGMGVTEDPGTYIERTAKELECAPGYWVSPEMSTMITAAARAMPRGRDDRPDHPYAENLPQAVLTQDLLLTSSGFALFEAPLEDDQFRIVVSCDGAFAALSWYPDPEGEGVWVGWWTTGSDTGLTHLIPIPPAQYWPFGEPAPPCLLDLGNEASIALAFWLIVSQTTAGSRLSEISEVSPERHARKRAERAGIQSRTLRLVKLRRRPASATGGHREVEWTHRHCVTGHWKHVRVKAGHRLTWINPYIRGPEDKPLIVKDNVYRVDR